MRPNCSKPKICEGTLGKMQKSGENFAIRLFEGGKFGREINRNDGK
jgi:hypothetical protein